ncbi:cell wall-binding repeat-containing protein [Microcella sp.]|uniref:cell wall-binding repeat-containing protein n=1 Tax=Microcella sp. TaxID=1913979 RepID=UPI00255E61DF|nr:cell wall-binding repeat-containing protein [Microcella sp.]MBX9472733.1 cell wall-binding repeat-containing protein [Microcella sp.]
MLFATTRRSRRALLATLAAAATLVAGLVVAPASAMPVAEPTPAPIDQRQAGDVTLDPARVDTGLGVEPVADAALFSAGYLINDHIFFNRSAMSEAQIQAFLDSMLSGPCTTAYCLANYRMNTIDKTPSPRCEDGYTGAANESAARIIFKVQQSCGISAKVILVTLQKEQSLVTRTGPTERTLERAMGFFCPDDPARPGWCDPRYAGLQNQLYNAAAQFQWYRLYPNNYNFQVGVENIQYHPSTACGTKRVTIANQATAGLYNYTPYTPNNAALANLYGTGDSCSSYGNRNFWRLFTDWFGSPTVVSIPTAATPARLAGADRFTTATLLSQATYPSATGGTVYVSVGTQFADGLAAAPAAAQVDAPLLLVETDRVPAVVRTELQRLNPARIIVVGGEGVVSATAYAALQAAVPGAELRRDSGIDRYATARAIARAAFLGDGTPGGAPVVFLANGDDFPDALAASAAAGHLGGPVLLVPGGATTLDAETRALITELGASRIVIAGGTGVVTAGIAVDAATVPGVTEVVRKGGASRFETAALLNDYAFDSPTAGFIAYGFGFPDALSAAAVAGAQGAPLALSNGICTWVDSLNQFADAGVSQVTLMGGTGVLGSSVARYEACG